MRLSDHTMKMGMALLTHGSSQSLCALRNAAGLTPRGRSAMSGTFLVVTTEGCVAGIWWVKARDAAKRPQCTGWSPEWELPSPHVLHAEAKDPK